MTQSTPHNWMSALPDDLPISEINIPGSHNAAAIDTKRRTRWACQDRSISDQLNQGIRLLDIRLKPANHSFITCHGHLGLFGANEFQPFETLLEECTSFLKTNPTETIILTLQIDDWRGTRKQNRPEILNTLQTILTRLPLINSPQIPTLKESRGKIYLLNRINDDPALGVPLNIPDNTPGAIIPKIKGRNFEVYVQDQYKGLNRRDPVQHKLNLTLAALEKKRPGILLLNYASATKPIGQFVYITKELLTHLTQQPSPAQPLGWLLLDYPFSAAPQTANLPTSIIATNFNHAR